MSGSDNPSSNLSEAVKAAKDFEEKHYDTKPGSDGEAEELSADDFKGAAAAVRNAIVGEPQDDSPSAAAAAGDEFAKPVAPTSPLNPATTPSSSAADDAPSLAAKITDKAAETLDSLQKAVEPTGDSKSQDPEVNEFRSLVGEVFANMRESIQSGDAEEKAPAKGVDAAAHTPAEPHDGVFAKVKAAGAAISQAIMPDAHAVERTAGQKWEDAKGEAKEGGRQLDQAARDAASAAADKTWYGAQKARGAADDAANKTREAANNAGDEAKRTAESADAKAQRFLDRSAGAAGGVAQESADLAQGAKDRVARDWQATKDGTRNMLDESSAAKQYEADHQPAQEEGFFSSISNKVRSVLPGGGGSHIDTRAGDHARSAADTASAKAEKGKQDARGYLNKADREAGRLADEARDEASRLGDRVSETADDVKRTVEDKLQAAEDYLTADMTPSTKTEAAVQSGTIPSNTADVVSGGVPTTNPSRY